MRERGMVHFDAHPFNVLADEQGVYFEDLGLALLDSFELTPGESAFHREHRDWDRYEVLRYLTNWFRRRGFPVRPEHVAVAEVMDEFYAAIAAGKWDVPYPREALLKADGGR